MKFAYAKKELNCHACPALIERGDPIVLNFTRRRTPEGASSYVMVFHLTCYMPWYEAMFNTKYNEWIHGAGNRTPRPKIGAPVTYSDPTKSQKLNRLYSNLSYNRKIGNEVKVRYYTEQLAKLQQNTA
ncbi:MAG: hypothetical protein ACWGQW_00590 [bacterium]